MEVLTKPTTQTHIEASSSSLKAKALAPSRQPKSQNNTSPGRPAVRKSKRSLSFPGITTRNNDLAEDKYESSKSRLLSVQNYKRLFECKDQSLYNMDDSEMEDDVRREPSYVPHRSVNLEPGVTRRVTRRMALNLMHRNPGEYRSLQSLMDPDFLEEFLKSRRKRTSLVFPKPWPDPIGTSRVIDKNLTYSRKFKSGYGLDEGLLNEGEETPQWDSLNGEENSVGNGNEDSTNEDEDSPNEDEDSSSEDEDSSSEDEDSSSGDEVSANEDDEPPDEDEEPPDEDEESPDEDEEPRNIDSLNEDDDSPNGKVENVSRRISGQDAINLWMEPHETLQRVKKETQTFYRVQGRDAQKSEYPRRSEILQSFGVVRRQPITKSNVVKVKVGKNHPRLLVPPNQFEEWWNGMALELRRSQAVSNKNPPPTASKSVQTCLSKPLKTKHFRPETGSLLTIREPFIRKNPQRVDSKVGNVKSVIVVPSRMVNVNGSSNRKIPLVPSGAIENDISEIPSDKKDVSNIPTSETDVSKTPTTEKSVQTNRFEMGPRNISILPISSTVVTKLSTLKNVPIVNEVSNETNMLKIGRIRPNILRKTHKCTMDKNISSTRCLSSTTICLPSTSCLPSSSCTSSTSCCTSSISTDALATSVRTGIEAAVSKCTSITSNESSITATDTSVTTTGTGIITCKYVSTHTPNCMSNKSASMLTSCANSGNIPSDVKTTSYRSVKIPSCTNLNRHVDIISTENEKCLNKQFRSTKELLPIGIHPNETEIITIDLTGSDADVASVIEDESNETEGGTETFQSETAIENEMSQVENEMSLVENEMSQVENEMSQAENEAFKITTEEFKITIEESKIEEFKVTSEEFNLSNEKSKHTIEGLQIRTEKLKARTDMIEAGTKTIEAGTKTIEAGTKTIGAVTGTTEDGIETIENGTKDGTERIQVGTETTEIGNRKTEVRIKETEVLPEGTEVGTEKNEVRTKETEVESKKTEIGTKKTEVWTKKTEVGTKKTEVGIKPIKYRTETAEVGTETTQVGTELAEVGTEMTEVIAKMVRDVSKFNDAVTCNALSIVNQMMAGIIKIKEGCSNIGKHTSETSEGTIIKADRRKIARDFTNLIKGVSNSIAGAANSIDVTANSLDDVVNMDVATKSIDVAANSNVTAKPIDVAANSIDNAENKDVSVESIDDAGDSNDVARNSRDVARNSDDVGSHLTNVAANCTDVAENVNDVVVHLSDAAKNSNDVADNSNDSATNSIYGANKPKEDTNNSIGDTNNSIKSKNNLIGSTNYFIKGTNYLIQGTNNVIECTNNIIECTNNVLGVKNNSIEVTNNSISGVTKTFGNQNGTDSTDATIETTENQIDLLRKNAEIIRIETNEETTKIFSSEHPNKIVPSRSLTAINNTLTRNLSIIHVPSRSADVKTVRISSKSPAKFKRKQLMRRKMMRKRIMEMRSLLLKRQLMQLRGRQRRDEERKRDMGKIEGEERKSDIGKTEDEERKCDTGIFEDEEKKGIEGRNKQKEIYTQGGRNEDKEQADDGIIVDNSFISSRYPLRVPDPNENNGTESFLLDPSDKKQSAEGTSGVNVFSISSDEAELVTKIQSESRGTNLKDVDKSVCFDSFFQAMNLSSAPETSNKTSSDEEVGRNDPQSEKAVLSDDIIQGLARMRAQIAQLMANPKVKRKHRKKNFTVTSTQTGREITIKPEVIEISDEEEQVYSEHIQEGVDAIVQRISKQNCLQGNTEGNFENTQLGKLTLAGGESLPREEIPSLEEIPPREESFTQEESFPQEESLHQEETRPPEGSSPHTGISSGCARDSNKTSEKYRNVSDQSLRKESNNLLTLEESNQPNVEPQNVVEIRLTSSIDHLLQKVNTQIRRIYSGKNQGSSENFLLKIGKRRMIQENKSGGKTAFNCTGGAHILNVNSEVNILENIGEELQGNLISDRGDSTDISRKVGERGDVAKESLTTENVISDEELKRRVNQEDMLEDEDSIDNNEHNIIEESNPKSIPEEERSKRIDSCMSPRQNNSHGVRLQTDGVKAMTDWSTCIREPPLRVNEALTRPGSSSETETVSERSTPMVIGQESLVNSNIPSGLVAQDATLQIEKKFQSEYRPIGSNQLRKEQQPQRETQNQDKFLESAKQQLSYRPYLPLEINQIPPEMNQIPPEMNQIPPEINENMQMINLKVVSNPKAVPLTRPPPSYFHALQSLNRSHLSCETPRTHPVVCMQQRNRTRFDSAHQLQEPYKMPDAHQNSPSGHQLANSMMSFSPGCTNQNAYKRDRAETVCQSMFTSPGRVSQSRSILCPGPQSLGQNQNARIQSPNSTDHRQVFNQSGVVPRSRSMTLPGSLGHPDHKSANHGVTQMSGRMRRLLPQMQSVIPGRVIAGPINRMPGPSVQLPGENNEFARIIQIPEGNNQTFGSINHIAGSNNQIPGSVNEIPGSINQIPRSVNLIPGSVNQILGRISGSPGRLDQICGNLNQVLNQNTGSLNQVPGSLNQVPGSLNQVPGGSNQVRGGLSHVSGGLSRVPVSLNQISGNVCRMPGTTNQISGSMNCVPGSVNRIRGSVNQIHGSMNQAPGNMNRFPASENQYPASKNQFPASKNQFPPSKNQCPGSYNQFPESLIQIGSASLMPGNIDQIPAKIIQIQGNMNQTPGSMIQMSGTMNQVPVSMNHIPGSLTQIPRSMTQIPGSVNQNPVSMNQITGGINGIPGSINEIPGSINDIPRSINEIPGSSIQVPQTIKKIPESLMRYPGNVPRISMPQNISTRLPQMRSEGNELRSGYPRPVFDSPNRCPREIMRPELQLRNNEGVILRGSNELHQFTSPQVGREKRKTAPWVINHTKRFRSSQDNDEYHKVNECHQVNKYLQVNKYHQANKEYEQADKEYHQGDKEYHQGNKEYHQGNKDYHQGNKEYHTANKEYHQAIKEYQQASKEYRQMRWSYEIDPMFGNQRENLCEDVALLSLPQFKDIEVTRVPQFKDVEITRVAPGAMRAKAAEDANGWQQQVGNVEQSSFGVRPSLEQMKRVEDERKLREGRSEFERNVELLNSLQVQVTEGNRQAPEVWTLEDVRKWEGVRRSEEMKRAEEARKLREKRHVDEARKVEEVKRADEMRKAEEVRKAGEVKKAEEMRKAAEVRRAEVAKKAEEMREAEEMSKAEDSKKAEEMREVEAKRQEEGREAGKAVALRAEEPKKDESRSKNCKQENTRSEEQFVREMKARQITIEGGKIDKRNTKEQMGVPQIKELEKLGIDSLVVAVAEESRKRKESRRVIDVRMPAILNKQTEHSKNTEESRQSKRQTEPSKLTLTEREKLDESNISGDLSKPIDLTTAKSDDKHQNLEASDSSRSKTYSLPILTELWDASREPRGSCPDPTLRSVQITQLMLQSAADADAHVKPVTGTPSAEPTSHSRKRARVDSENADVSPMLSDTSITQLINSSKSSKTISQMNVELKKFDDSSSETVSVTRRQLATYSRKKAPLKVAIPAAVTASPIAGSVFATSPVTPSTDSESTVTTSTITGFSNKDPNADITDTAKSGTESFMKSIVQSTVESIMDSAEKKGRNLQKTENSLRRFKPLMLKSGTSQIVVQSTSQSSGTAFTNNSSDLQLLNAKEETIQIPELGFYKDSTNPSNYPELTSSFLRQILRNRSNSTHIQATKSESDLARSRSNSLCTTRTASETSTSPLSSNVGKHILPAVIQRNPTSVSEQLNKRRIAVSKVNDQKGLEKKSDCGDAKSADAKSADAKSADAKSTDVKSADAKSADAKSEDVKVTDAKSVTIRSPEKKSTDPVLVVTRLSVSTSGQSEETFLKTDSLKDKVVDELCLEPAAANSSGESFHLKTSGSFDTSSCAEDSQVKNKDDSRILDESYQNNGEKNSSNADLLESYSMPSAMIQTDSEVQQQKEEISSNRLTTAESLSSIGKMQTHNSKWGESDGDLHKNSTNSTEVVTPKVEDPVEVIPATQSQQLQNQLKPNSDPNDYLQSSRLLKLLTQEKDPDTYSNTSRCSSKLSACSKSGESNDSSETPRHRLVLKALKDLISKPQVINLCDEDEDPRKVSNYKASVINRRECSGLFVKPPVEMALVGRSTPQFYPYTRVEYGQGWSNAIAGNQRNQPQNPLVAVKRYSNLIPNSPGNPHYSGVAPINTYSNFIGPLPPENIEQCNYMTGKPQQYVNHYLANDKVKCASGQMEPMVTPSKMNDIYTALSALHGGEILMPEEYVREMELLAVSKELSLFKGFYKYVTNYQIVCGAPAMTFRAFLRLWNAGQLNTAHKKYQEYQQKHLLKKA